MIIQGDHKSATRMITVTRYTPKNHQTWNEFVKQSRQGTFLFDRNYMDYHQDRFHDHSLMIYYKDKLYALLPANEVVSASNNEIPQKELVSHQGLTYGGLLTCNKMTAELTCETFEAIGNYLKQEGFSKLTYKAIPWIYHKIPSEEDLYALIHVGKASLSAREISTTILLQNKLRFSEQRRRGVNKAKKNSLIIRQSSQEDVFAFWNILNNNLQQKYHTRPVHSNEELQLLMSRFPENIIGYSVLKVLRPNRRARGGARPWHGARCGIAFRRKIATEPAMTASGRARPRYRPRGRASGPERRVCPSRHAHARLGIAYRAGTETAANA